ncbi:MAG: alpha/beta hydrolase, partial [Ferruginibacter sp.]|nr:alpha/beta hydrolase [Ferruginibacter sp.]
MLKLFFAILLILFSLLVLKPAPANILWLVAVAITNFPYVPMLLAACSFYFGTQATKYHWPIMLVSLAAFIIYALPVIAAYKQTKQVPMAMKNIFPVQQEDSLPPVFGFTKMFGSNKNVSYKSLPYKKVDGKDLSLDFYLSSNNKISPLVIVIHGGSWQGGDSKQLPELNSYLSLKGFNVAAINYRLAPAYKAPAPVEDTRDAIKYLMAHATALNIDTNNIVLLGRSAGAQIALNAAYGFKLPNIKGVISYYGPADMVWGGQIKVSRLVLNTDLIYDNYFGGNYKQVPNKFVESSGLESADKFSPPTLLIHGKTDPLVSFYHAVHLQKKLNALKVPNYFL